MLWVASLLLVSFSQGFRQANKGEVCRVRGPELHSTNRRGGSGGHEFNHWREHALAGAIDQICVRHGSRIDAITVCYAGNCIKNGGNGGRQNCFKLRHDEFITRITGRSGSMIDALQFFASNGTHTRDSLRFGGGGGHGFEWKAPAGQHLMSIFGDASSNGLYRLGLYWGAGGGTGSWVKLPLTHDSPTGNDYNHTICSSRSSSSTSSIETTWETSAYREMSTGIEAAPFDVGVSATETIGVAESYAKTVVRSTSEAFSTSSCLSHFFSCDKKYVYQWQMTSNFDGRGVVKSRSGQLICTDEPAPCCLPGTFSDPKDASNCDLDDKAPKLC